jgi:hypothetical protein
MHIILDGAIGTGFISLYGSYLIYSTVGMAKCIPHVW